MKSDSWDVVVVGAGAAGLFAAIHAAERGLSTLLLEKNNKPGVKILMSGGTRCNLTHATDRRGITDAFERDQGRFLRAPLAALGPEELVDFFEREGLATKVESTGKVFPKTDRALDVQRTLLRRLEHSGAMLRLGDGVDRLEKLEERFRIEGAGQTHYARKVILAVGGKSYPGCGTEGDGYSWAKQQGHSIVPPRPALVPVKTDTPWSHALSGVTLPDVKVHCRLEGTKPNKQHRRGSFLFTHFGLSGPAAMDVSRELTGAKGSAAIVADFLPNLPEQHLIEAIAAFPGGRQLIQCMADWLPRRVMEAVFSRAGLPADRLVAELSKRERRSLVDFLKQCEFPITGTIGFAKAEVTAGGVSLDEVDSRTMESKRCDGLYIVGELLDIDGPIGGYNFQAAFSTGYLAGCSV